jgi:hypothetical protein
LRRKSVAVPEWDGDVILRELTGAERLALSAGVLDLYQVLGEGGVPKTGDDVRRAIEFAARVVQMAWIGEAGQQVVGPEQFDMLLGVPWDILMTLAGEALTLSRMTPGDIDTLKKSSSTTTS